MFFKNMLPSAFTGNVCFAVSPVLIPKVGASKVTFNHGNIVIKMSFSVVIFQIQADELKLVPM
jgi:hypothetical protein